MKITYNEYQNMKNVTKEISVHDAVKHTLDHYHTDGEIEYIKERIENQRDMMAKLVQVLADKKVLSAADLSNMIDREFKAE